MSGNPRRCNLKWWSNCAHSSVTATSARAARTGVRDLATQLGFRANTVTGAYETLISEGYLRTERTVGTFVAASRRTMHPPFSLGAGNGATHRQACIRAMNLPAALRRPRAFGTAPADTSQIENDFVFGRHGARSFLKRPGAAS